MESPCSYSENISSSVSCLLNQYVTFQNVPSMHSKKLLEQGKNIEKLKHFYCFSRTNILSYIESFSAVKFTNKQIARTYIVFLPKIDRTRCVTE